MTEKVCRKCFISKPISEFKLREGRWPASWCRRCHSLDRMERIRNEKKRDPEGFRAREKIYRINGLSKKLQRLYGITLEQYRQILKLQGNICAICGTGNPGKMGRFYVDHCHVTKRVRGLLCNLCNVGIGSMGDDPTRLRRAAEYLEKSGYARRLQ
ncbi:MAG: endonuclease VII domain-containing protein [Deltaproteobacteria bacterium]|nr:endonuclease VII domain-containing protein [Deltaproteobacteria bacterium]